MSKQRGLKVAPPAGTKVRLTGYFLKCTGQQCGPEGLARWTVIPAGESGFGVDDRAGFVFVNEPVDVETQRALWSDIKSTRADGRLMRTIAIGNLEIVGAPPKAADMADDVPPVKLMGGY
jgi:hypothetical protein